MGRRMIKTSLKAKIPTEFDTGLFYCPYIPDISIKSNCEIFKPERKVGFKQRKEEDEDNG